MDIWHEHGSLVTSALLYMQIKLENLGNDLMNTPMSFVKLTQRAKSSSRKKHHVSMSRLVPFGFKILTYTPYEIPSPVNA